VTSVAPGPEILRAVIAASGLSQVRYAETVLFRNPRTVRRWLAGDAPIPRAVMQFLIRRPS
jgi:hypothetical protein